MKFSKIILAFSFIIIRFAAQAQVGFGTNTPETSAQLDVSSTSKGFLPPRMTFAQKVAISNPDAGLTLWCSNCGSNGELQVYNGSAWVNVIGGPALGVFPIVGSTTAITSDSFTSATSGGNITSDGGNSITKRGICWSLNQNPTITDSKTEEAGTIGSFTSSITGLTTDALYYVRSYATNAEGTAYGNQLSFTAGIGSPYQGGVVAYFLKSGDTGYDANVFHGLIAATSDQSAAIRWHNGSNTVTGSIGTAIGTGFANTNTIISAQGELSTSYAAGLARAYNGGGKTDWYLPSKDELNQLYLNKNAIGGFASDTKPYWTSSETGIGSAWAQIFNTGLTSSVLKSGSSKYVRAIRSF